MNERQRENVELARRGFEAFNARDFEATFGILDSEVEVFTAQGMINAGTHRGHDGFMEWLRGWLEAWESFKVEVQETHPVGDDHVVVDAHQVGHGMGSGIEVTMDVAYLFEVRGGKATRVHLYDDRAEAFQTAERLAGRPDA